LHRDRRRKSRRRRSANHTRLRLLVLQIRRRVALVGVRRGRAEVVKLRRRVELRYSSRGRANPHAPSRLSRLAVLRRAVTGIIVAVRGRRNHVGWRRGRSAVDGSTMKGGSRVPENGGRRGGRTGDGARRHRFVDARGGRYRRACGRGRSREVCNGSRRFEWEKVSDLFTTL
jgi:hypothetical protein